MANPFRVLSDGDGVHLYMRASTFWMRLRANLCASVRRMLFVMASLSVVPLLALLGLQACAFSWTLSALMATLVGSLVLVPLLASMLMQVVLASLCPHPLEAMFPRRISFYPDHIELQPRKGKERCERYSWLAGAQRTSRGLLLSLAHDAQLHVEVNKTVVGPAAMRRLESCLRANGIIR